MLEKLNMRLFGAAFVIVVLLCAGIHFYIEWSNKRFVSELKEPPQSITLSEPPAKAENDEMSTTLIEPMEFVSEDASKDTVVSEPEPVDVSELVKAPTA